MTNGNYTVFGLKKGDPEWKECLLCDTGSKERYELCLKKAVELGYEITRVYKPDTILSAPDFTKAINV